MPFREVGEPDLAASCPVAAFRTSWAVTVVSAASRTVQAV